MPRGVFILTIIGMVSCTGGSQTGSIVVRDSAGVVIVEHPAGFEETLPQQSLDSIPSVDIGGQDGQGYDLDRVGGAATLRDGRIVVIDRGSGELRFFDSAGRYLASAGRVGQGPGDFAFISSIQVLPGDMVFAVDGQLRRGSFFSPRGEFLRTIPMPHEAERSYLTGSALLRNGRLLGDHRRFSEMRETSGPVRRDPFAIILLGPGDTKVDTIVVVPDREVYPALGSEGGHEFPTLRSVQFGRTTVYSTDGSRIVVGTNEPGGIRFYSEDGKLVRIIRSATPPQPVTEEHRKRWEREALARLDQQRSVSEQVRAEWKKNEANRRYAETFPHYERLLLGTDGTLWLERPRHYEDEGRRFVVYDSSGHAIATVRCPERMRPFEVGLDRVIGLWRDADDVQHVRVYPVEKP